MQRFEVKPSAKVILVLGGAEYPMARPKLGLARDFEEKMAEAKAAGKGGIRLVMEYLCACGLPEPVVSELDTSEMEQIVAALTPAKKN